MQFDASGALAVYVVGVTGSLVVEPIEVWKVVFNLI
jgi:hypothetical protein